MKKYFVGILSVALAVVCFSFTPNDAKRLNCNASDDYVWFAVSVADFDCQAFASITGNQVIPTGHFASTSTSTTPALDLNTSGNDWILRESLAGTLNDAQEKFGCITSDDFVCAVAYDVNQLNTSYFELVNDASSPSGKSWKPKTAGPNIPVPVCAICKP